MEIKPARRIESLPAYAFAVVDSKVEELRARGIEPVDFGVGDPTTPTPEAIRRACKEAIDDRATAGYPSYIGDTGFREAVAAWSKRRFGVELDPGSEISSTVGSKEGIFNFHEAFVDPGDLVLVPSPGYPPYSRGAWFAEGRTWFYPLLEENGFLPDLDAIPAEVAREARLIWINYPNSPTGVCPGLDFFERLYAWTSDHGIILASDEAYSEHYYGDQPPPTALQAGGEGVVVFNSMSKRSAMTCWRVGWICGDRRIVGVYRKMKTNVDSGTPTFIQDAAAAALTDEAHVEQMRAEYRRKRDITAEALTAAGLPRCVPEGTLYIWQRVPDGMSSLEFAEMLMQPEIAVVCTPGSLLADEVEGGLNPGEGFVRFALTPEMDDVERAAERIATLSF
jgi:LL-diaminopimelate aminotransferase